MKQIILIDDKIEKSKELKIKLDECLKQTDDKFEAVIWDKEILAKKYDEQFEKNDDSISNADEDIWSRVFENEEDIICIVSDHDLSGLNNIRISESVLANACKKVSIPICTYHRQSKNTTESHKLRKSINQSRSFSIEIDITNKYAANEIISIAKGFLLLKNEINLKEIDELKKGPSFIISSILKKPELETNFSRYSSSNTLASDIIKNKNDFISDGNLLKIKIPFILGCWLYNYILPFPGVILNSIAAASFINLDVDSFNEYNELFNAAKYTGPFSENTNYWWRHDLDKILIENNCEDGVELLQKHHITTASPCKCSVSQESPAGFYCLVTQLPISLEESTGNLSWVADGADLCRINKEIYDQLAPMMGL